MAPALAGGFANWLKTNPNMKLLSDASVTRVSCEGITNLDSLRDFDHKSIKKLPDACSRAIAAIAEDVANGIAAEAAVPAANISSVSVNRLCIASDAAKYYHSIGRTLTLQKMHWNNVLATFKIEFEAYEKLREEDEPKVPRINDRDSERKIIRWAPIFEDHLSRCFGATGPLSYIIRESAIVPIEADDPLSTDPTGTINGYYGSSGSLIDELVKRLPHNGPIFKNDNATVYMKIEEAVRGTSVESSIKSFSRTKNGRGAYLALVAITQVIPSIGPYQRSALITSKM